jgi:tRNA A37 threonylcarbamoyladenosine synthetase subunit TsaC/SUA5/YrdC
MYVLPVAAWILSSGAVMVSPSEAMVGLNGRADRSRIIEALSRLVEIGALKELPRAGTRAPRIFERVEDPYWNLAAKHAADSGSVSQIPG